MSKCWLNFKHTFGTFLSTPCTTYGTLFRIIIYFLRFSVEIITPLAGKSLIVFHYNLDTKPVINNK